MSIYLYLSIYLSKDEKSNRFTLKEDEKAIKKYYKDSLCTR